MTVNGTVTEERVRGFAPNIYLALVVLGFALHAGLRGIGSDYDAQAYRDWFEAIHKYSATEFFGYLGESGWYLSSDLFQKFESGFAILTFLISRVIDTPDAYFVVLALISLSMKAIALVKYCQKPTWAFLWYFSGYYFLMEMTTVRAGLAVGIILLGHGLLLGARWKTFLAVTLLAASFHIMAISALVLLILMKYRLSPRGLIVLIGAGLLLSTISLLPLIEILGGFSEKLIEYQLLFTELDLYTSINIFNVVVLLRVVLLIVVVLGPRDPVMDSPGFAYALNVYSMSLFFYFAFSSFPIVGGRIYEFLGVFQVFFIGYYARIFARRPLPIALLILTLVAQFAIPIFHARFVDFFYFIGERYNLQSTHVL